MPTRSTRESCSGQRISWNVFFGSSQGSNDIMGNPDADPLCGDISDPLSDVAAPLGDGTYPLGVVSGRRLGNSKRSESGGRFPGGDFPGISISRENFRDPGPDCNPYSWLRNLYFRHNNRERHDARSLGGGSRSRFAPLKCPSNCCLNGRHESAPFSFSTPMPMSFWFR